MVVFGADLSAGFRVAPTRLMTLGVVIRPTSPTRSVRPLTPLTRSGSTSLRTPTSSAMPGTSRSLRWSATLTMVNHS